MHGRWLLDLIPVHPQRAPMSSHTHHWDSIFFCQNGIAGRRVDRWGKCLNKGGSSLSERWNAEKMRPNWQTQFSRDSRTLHSTELDGRYGCWWLEQDQRVHIQFKVQQRLPSGYAELGTGVKQSWILGISWGENERGQSQKQNGWWRDIPYSSYVILYWTWPTCLDMLYVSLKKALYEMVELRKRK